MGKKQVNKLTDQLRRFVVESGESLGELSRATGLHKSALSNFVHGKRGVSMQGLDALGEHLGLRLVQERPRGKKGR